MKNKYYDLNFFTQWFDNKLTPKQEAELKKSEDYSFFKTLREATDDFEQPEYKKEQLYKKIQDKINEEPGNKPILPRWFYLAAACLALLMGLGYYFTRPVVYESGFGEQQTVFLPDGSKVLLNSKAVLKYREFNWNERRTVALEGEGYFEVNPGSVFEVLTSEGGVQVVGTEFNVNAQPAFFEVACYEGRVRVKPQKHEVTVLDASQGLRVVNGQLETVKPKLRPGWFGQESVFENTPLKQVIIQLENRFGVRFRKENVDLNQRFTGSFSNDSLKLALQTVFIPMEVSFSVKNEKTVILKGP